MTTDEGNQADLCPCGEYCMDCAEGFEKIVSLNNTGLVIYRRIQNPKVVKNDGGNVMDSTNSFILHNTKETTLKTMDFITEIEYSEISCPRCRLLMKDALKLLQTLPATILNKNYITGICDHCRLKQPCYECKESVKKFISSKNETSENANKHMKEWLSKWDENILGKKDPHITRNIPSSQSGIDQILLKRYTKRKRDLVITELFSKSESPELAVKRIEPNERTKNRISFSLSDSQLEPVGQFSTIVGPSGEIIKLHIPKLDEDGEFYSSDLDDSGRISKSVPGTAKDYDKANVITKERKNDVPLVPFQSEDGFFTVGDTGKSDKLHVSAKTNSVLPNSQKEKYYGDDSFPDISPKRYAHDMEKYLKNKDKGIEDTERDRDVDLNAKSKQRENEKQTGREKGLKYHQKQLEDGKIDRTLDRKVAEQKYNISDGDKSISRHFSFSFPQDIQSKEILKRHKSSSELIQDTKAKLLARSEYEKERSVDRNKMEMQKKRLAEKDKAKQGIEKSKLDEDKKLEEEAKELQRSKHGEKQKSQKDTILTEDLKLKTTQKQSKPDIRMLKDRKPSSAILDKEERSKLVQREPKQIELKQIQKESEGKQKDFQQKQKRPGKLDGQNIKEHDKLSKKESDQKQKDMKQRQKQSGKLENQDTKEHDKQYIKEFEQKQKGLKERQKESQRLDIQDIIDHGKKSKSEKKQKELKQKQNESGKVDDRDIKEDKRSLKIGAKTEIQQDYTQTQKESGQKIKPVADALKSAINKQQSQRENKPKNENKGQIQEDKNKLKKKEEVEPRKKHGKSDIGLIKTEQGKQEIKESAGKNIRTENEGKEQSKNEKGQDIFKEINQQKKLQQKQTGSAREKINKESTKSEKNAPKERREQEKKLKTKQGNKDFDVNFEKYLKSSKLHKDIGAKHKTLQDAEKSKQGQEKTKLDPKTEPTTTVDLNKIKMLEPSQGNVVTNIQKPPPVSPKEPLDPKGLEYMLKQRRVRDKEKPDRLPSGGKGDSKETDKPSKVMEPEKKVTAREHKPKEINIEGIKLLRPSQDYFVLELVKLKQSHKNKVCLSDLMTPLEIEDHRKSHKALKEETCLLCINSDIELEYEIRKAKANAITEIIKGQKLFKCKHPRSAKSERQEIVPLLFQKTYNENEAAEVPLGTPIDEKYTTQISGKLLKSSTETEVEPKGVIRYALSDRSFIEKGWTMLPTEKVVRKMNVYRMRPAHPEFDWFEHNKSKGLMNYETGERLAEFDDNGRGRWYYRNGRLALDYYDAEELNAQQRFVIYSTGQPDERGRSQPYTIIATFDYLGNGVVFDHSGKIRLKYNQTEGVVLDRSIGPVSHWKWHTLNDPPVLQQVMIDTQMSHKDPDILKMGGRDDDKTRPENEEMLAIEFDNFIKEKSKKLTQSFKPFQIKMKALKINEHFSLKVLDQATVYLIFRDGTTNLKLNIGMILDHKEIVDTDTAEVGEVSNSLERFPARTDSLAGLQRSVAYAQRFERNRTQRERRLRPTEPCASADKLTAAASRPLRQPLRLATSTTSASTNCYCKSRKPTSNNTYYNSRLL